MSGIFGIYSFQDQPIPASDLQAMADRLSHRGPDGSATWLDGAIGLGHRQLWTTSESLREQQPEADDSDRYVITADARIDNRDQLIAALGLEGTPPEKITDVQLILAAYGAWEEDCPQHLVGDFAFALWDKPRSRLFCTRDHMGVKPFYYHHSDRGFAFASEIKALFCLTWIPRQLSQPRFADFLSMMMQDRELTTYEGILRLPPAHSLTVDQTELVLRQYWSLDRHRELRLESNAAYGQEFRRIFTEAVRCRLRRAYPLICHLSGGLDSSSVACVARNLLRQEPGQPPLPTLSNVFDQVPECDERPYIRAVLDQGGFQPHFMAGDDFGPLSDVGEIFAYQDEALLGPSHFYSWRMNRFCKELGARVVLDGFDGDTVVCHGLPRLAELAIAGQWQTCLDEAAAIAKRYQKTTAKSIFQAYGLPHLQAFSSPHRWFSLLRGIQAIHQRFGTSRKALFLKYGLKPWLASLRGGESKAPPQSEFRQLPSRLIAPAFAQATNLLQRAERLQGFDTTAPPTVREFHWQGLSHGILAYTFEQIDQYAAAHSLEARHPFMDKRLIEYCLALPAEQKLADGFGRIALRHAMAGILPEQVRWRGNKADMTPNFVSGLVQTNHHQLHVALTDKLKSLTQAIDIAVLQASYQRLLSGDRATGADRIITWQAAALASWLDHHQLTLDFSEDRRHDESNP
jgi:asparagine synthase (glutamine-hydrolysing)